MPFLDSSHHDAPVMRVRDLAGDEAFVLAEYEAHSRKCSRCLDALDTFREGRLLCERGLSYARDVANYIFTKQGKAYSAVDNEHDEEVLVRIPREYKASRRLLLAIEEGLRLRREQPIISYDATYPVSARQPAETVTEIFERAPRPRRRVIVYRRPSPGRTSSSRGSLYEADRADRQERRSYVRVLRWMNDNI